MIAELTRVRLTEPVEGLLTGTEGWVVGVYQNGAAYEVEFLRPGIAPDVVLTVKADQIEVVT